MYHTRRKLKGVMRAEGVRRAARRVGAAELVPGSDRAP